MLLGTVLTPPTARSKPFCKILLSSSKFLHLFNFIYYTTKILICQPQSKYFRYVQRKTYSVLPIGLTTFGLNKLIDTTYQKSLSKYINHCFVNQSLSYDMVLIYYIGYLLPSAIQDFQYCGSHCRLCVIQHLSDMTVYSDFSTLLLFTFRCHWNHLFHHTLRYK